METTRQLKFARLIHKELGDIFQRDAKSILGGAFVTLTKVKITPDLSLAKVYMSFMLVPDKEAALQNVTENTKVIRKLLGDKIKKQARIIPNLQFYIDDNLDYASKMDNLISGLDIPPAPEEDEDQDKE
jgi:ribosome-binding factor A